MVEYSSNLETTTDPNVERELNKNGNLVKAKEAQINVLQTRIAELQGEHQFIQEAAAKFSIYMKKNSITHYNDATIEYMDHLIKDERSKLRAGASRARLERLERDKAQYQSYVDAMEAGKRTSSTHILNEPGVALLVQQLYNLKHYGRMLKDLAHVVGRAYAANFREKPCRIQGKRFWTRDSGGTDEQRLVVRLSKWQQVRQSLLPVGDDPLEDSSSGGAIRSPRSRLKRDLLRSNENDMGESSSRIPRVSPPPRDEKGPAPVKSILDWVDEEPALTDQESVSRSGFVRDKSAPPAAEPPPYTEGPETKGAGAMHNGGADPKPKIWSRMKNMLRRI